MNNHGITKENLMGALPLALRGDPSVVALAEALATVLADRLPEIDRLRIYPSIDTLDESLLDILAYDFKVDWWDPEYTLEEKRRTLKDSWRVHKLLGTKAAVVTAISAIYPHTQVLEWFEYGGEPYHFRLDINITNDSIDSDKQRRVLERLNFYKSLRSHVDEVTYSMLAAAAMTYAGAAHLGSYNQIKIETRLSADGVSPNANIALKAGGGALWISHGLSAAARINGNTGPPCASTSASVGASVNGIYMNMRAAGAKVELEHPYVEQKGCVGGRLYGVFQKMEVRINGTLD